jgi:hypothetical protein
MYNQRKIQSFSITYSLNLLSNKTVAVFDIDRLSKDHALQVSFSFSTTINKLFDIHI